MITVHHFWYTYCPLTPVFFPLIFDSRYTGEHVLAPIRKLKCFPKIMIYDLWFNIYKILVVFIYIFFVIINIRAFFYVWTICFVMQQPRFLFYRFRCIFSLYCTSVTNTSMGLFSLKSNVNSHFTQLQVWLCYCLKRLFKARIFIYFFMLLDSFHYIWTLKLLRQKIFSIICSKKLW